MLRLKLIHWNVAEARERARALETARYTVDFDIPDGAQFLKKLIRNPPAAVIIDLSRLPSQGRDIAFLLRNHKSTRSIPLIFVEGDAEKVDRVKGLLPDAIYARWNIIRSSLRKAIAHPPLHPVSPRSVFEAYTGVSLTKKLGIRPGLTVSLAGAPSDFEKKLGALPPGVALNRRAATGSDLIIWFNRSRGELVRKLEGMTRILGTGKLWIVWPKRGGKLVSDLTQQLVREKGLAAGLVDFKICSIDETWSGLLFTRRKAE